MTDFKMSDAERIRNRKYQADFKKRHALFHEAMRQAIQAVAALPGLLDAYGNTRKANVIRKAIKLIEDEE